MPSWCPVYLLLSWLAGSVALAEEPPEEDSAPAVVGPEEKEKTAYTLPVLLGYMRAAYPKHALERAIEASVLLSLTVAEDGTVVEVEVVEPAGDEFDGPAAEAAWTMKFTPAMDATGQPAPARIQYRYLFEMSDVPPLSLQGVVRETGGARNVLMSGVRVRATGPDDMVARTVTDDEGTFRFAELAAGKWVLSIHGEGLLSTSGSVDVLADGYTDGVVLHTERVHAWETAEYAESIEVTGERQVDPAEREVSHDTIVHLPGSLGDPVRALQNLPGVARAPFGSGQLLVRGSDASDTGYYLEGMPIPIAFHFTGVSTVVAADLLAGVELIPGSAGARYGRAIGGIVNLDVDENLPAKGTTNVSADIFQATVFTKQRLGKSTALILSARRSYADAVVQPILSSNGSNALRVPVYYDAQLHLMRTVARTGRISLTGLVSDDRFRLLGDTTDAVLYGSRFSRVMGRWMQPIGLTGWSVETAVSVGPEKQELVLSGEDAGDVGALPVDLFSGLSADGEVVEEALPEWAFRHEWLRPAGDSWIGVRLGFDGQTGLYDMNYTVGREDSGQETIQSAAFYLEPTVRIGPVDLLPGVRSESFRLVGEPWRTSVDPRFRIVVGGESNTRVVAAWGRYSQMPATRELLSEEEGSDLTLEQARHASLSLEQSIGPFGHLGLTGYHHRMWDLVVGRENLFRFDRTSLVGGDDFEPFANDGTGEAYGAELFATYNTEKRLVWLAVSLSHAERVDRPDQEAHPAEADQPVNVTLIASEAFGKWRAGLRTRLVSGPPITPVDAAVYSVDAQVWVPQFGDPFSARAPPFFALDVRVDRAFVMRRSRIDLYAEVQNITNYRNVEIPQWSEDYSRLQPVYGLPAFPAIGVKVTW
jgi:TonB family protein